MVAYADDITIITRNDPESVKGIFNEYYRLTKASGLKLNADKMEKFDIYSRNIANPMRRQVVQYGDQNYTVLSQNTIKINGVIFSKDVRDMKQANFELMRSKMCQHFKDWGNRSLSILGKIQIIKTFGISQYLYTLAVLDLDSEHWKIIYKDINKFLWNRTFHIQANNAPHRIQKDIVTKSITNGGFGMIDLVEVVAAARLQRYTYLQNEGSHPIARLQTALGAKNHLQEKAHLNIEDVTSGIMAQLRRHHLDAYAKLTNEQIAADLLLHRQILGCNIKNVIIKRMTNSIEMARLRFNHISTVKDALLPNGNNYELLCRVADPAVLRVLRAMWRIYRGGILPDTEGGLYLYDETRITWTRVELLTSKQIRLLTRAEHCLVTTKLFNLDMPVATELYGKIAKIKNVPNKAKILRLIHGDVYCGARTYRFGISDTDRCIRCFGEETIIHLLCECPYTMEVWGRLGIFPREPSDVLDHRLTVGELEIRAELISALVFRKKVLPPEILIRSVMSSFKNGLCRNRQVKDYAVQMIARYDLTGQWFT